MEAKLATSIRATKGNAKDMGDNGLPRRAYSLLPRSKYLAVIAFAALCLSLVELAVLFELPLVSNFSGAFASGSLFSMNILTSLLDIGYAGLFVLMVMESSAFPIPSEVVLPLAGYLVFLGKMNLGLAIIDATVAGLVGSLLDYYLAMRLGRPVVYRLLGRLGISSAHLDDGERWVDSKGSWSVFIGRFIPGVRSVISIPAGLLRMKLRPFVILTTAGSLIWSAGLVYLGYSAGPLWQSASGSVSRFADVAAFLTVAVLSVMYVVYYLRPLGRRGGGSHDL
jgi:membrane protein DedA with SNARE-associated domain